MPKEVKQEGPVITEETPTSVTTETRIETTEERPAIVSTVADVEAAIRPYVQRLESLETLFVNGNVNQRLQDLEKLKPVLEEIKSMVGSGTTVIDRIHRIEQIIKQHFGAHQLATAQPQD